MSWDPLMQKLLKKYNPWPLVYQNNNSYKITNLKIPHKIGIQVKKKCNIL